MVRNWQDVKYDDDLSKELSEAFHLATPDQSTLETRPAIVHYVKLVANRLRQLSDEDLLLHGSDLDGMTVYVLATNYENNHSTENWFNEQTEPNLIELLNLSSRLDAQNGSINDWKHFIRLAEELK